jgi:hypothetical protein
MRLVGEQGQLAETLVGTEALDLPRLAVHAPAQHDDAGGDAEDGVVATSLLDDMLAGADLPEAETLPARVPIAGSADLRLDPVADPPELPSVSNTPLEPAHVDAALAAAGDQPLGQGLLVADRLQRAAQGKETHQNLNPATNSRRVFGPKVWKLGLDRPA